jgi:hypothetical protein
LALLLLVCGCSCGGDGPVYQDDFDDPGSGWGTDEREEFDRGYEEGEYFFDLHKSDWFSWAHPGERFADVQIEASAQPASGSSGSHFGVLCRHVDIDNFYYFAISADGYYAIFRREGGGSLKVLTGDGEGMIHSPTIKTDGSTNRIRAVCRENGLSLYVNGEMVETVVDDTHARGDVGIGAGSGPVGDVRVQFDDFVVTVP